MRVKIKHVASQSLKILLCLVILFTFMFVQPKENLQKADAALPAILVAVLGSVVLDVAIDMGIDFVDKKAGQDWSKKLVGNLWNKYGQKISDLKPTKTNAGKWALNISKGLMAAIIDEIGDTVEDTIEKSKERELKNEETFKGVVSKEEIENVSDPFYKTGVYVEMVAGGDGAAQLDNYSYVMKYGHLELTPLAYEQKTKVSLCIDDECYSKTVDGGKSLQISYYDGFLFGGTSTRVFYILSDDRNFDSSDESGWFISTGGAFSRKVPLWKAYKKQLTEQNKVIYEFDGAIVTDGNKSIVRIPDGVSGDDLEELDFSLLPTSMQSDREFEFEINDSTIIDADFEVIDEGDSFDWELIEQDVINQGDNIYKDFEVDYSPVTNNNYTVTEQQQDDINNNIIVDIDVGSPSGKTDVDVNVEGFMYCVEKATSSVVPCKKIEAIDGGLLAYIGNAYDYAVNAVKSGVDGVATITAGATGLIALYSHIFSWLPSEVTVILTSGLLLMIGLRVFRK